MKENKLDVVSGFVCLTFLHTENTYSAVGEKWLVGNWEVMLVKDIYLFMVYFCKCN